MLFWNCRKAWPAPTHPKTLPEHVFQNIALGELDDVPFTELYCEFMARGFQVLKVSGDLNVVKSGDDVNKLQQYVAKAKQKGMAFDVTLHLIDPPKPWPTPLPEDARENYAPPSGPRRPPSPSLNGVPRPF